MSAIREARTLAEVVEIINASAEGQGTEYFGGTDTRSPEAMAAEYAADAAMEAGYVSKRDIQAHIDILTEAGASFDGSSVLSEAVRIIEMSEMTERERLLYANSHDWYVVDYDDGTTALKHKTALSSILECGLPTEDFGILSIEQCWNGEDLRS